MTVKLLKKSEDKVVKSCNTYLKKNGWVTKTMFTGGIPLGGGRYATNPCKGIPDCLAFNDKESVMIWIEYKREEGGIVSPEQKAWHFMLRACGQIVCIVNNIESLKKQLKDWGLHGSGKELAAENNDGKGTKRIKARTSVKIAV